MSEVATDDRQATDLTFEGIEFDSPEDLARQMAEDPEIWEKVNSKLDEIEDPNQAIMPEAFREPVEKEGETPEPKEGEEVNEKPAENEKPEEPEELALDGKIKPEWLGTYKTKERSIPEAIEQMHRGNVEKDKTIDYYKFEKTPALQKELENAKAEADRLKAEMEALKTTPPVVPEKGSANERKDTGSELEMQEVVVPDAPGVPSVPSLLEGDDLFDDAKVAENKKAFEQYSKDLLEYQQKSSEYNLAIAKKAAVDAAKQASSIALKDVEDVRAKLKAVEERTQQTEETKREQAFADHVQSEYDEIEELRAQHPDVFGQGRPIARIEADYTEFLSNLAGIAGVSGGIYKEDENGNRRIKTEISNALSAFQNETSPMGKKFRETASEKGIGLPDDFDTLQKVYAVRRIKNTNAVLNDQGQYVPIDYEEAFGRAQATKVLPDAKSEENTKRDDVLDEHKRRERALGEQDKFAKEADSASSGAKPSIDKMSPKMLETILDKQVSQRTTDDISTLWAIVDAKNLDPVLFDLDPNTRAK